MSDISDKFLFLKGMVSGATMITDPMGVAYSCVRKNPQPTVGGTGILCTSKRANENYFGGSIVTQAQSKRYILGEAVTMAGVTLLYCVAPWTFFVNQGSALLCNLVLKHYTGKTKPLKSYKQLALKAPDDS